MRCTIDGSACLFPGSTTVEVATNGTYHVCLIDAGGGAGQVHVDDSWPLYFGTYIPLATVVVNNNAIVSITDERNLTVYSVAELPADSTGINGTRFMLDKDNTGAGTFSVYRFSRGGSYAPSGLAWNEATATFQFLLNSVGATVFGPVAASSMELTTESGPPLVVHSSEKVVGLNADQVDGLGFGGTPAANQLLMASSGTQVDFLAVPTAGQILLGNSSGSPEFKTITGDIALDANGATTIANADIVAAGEIVDDSPVGGTPATTLPKWLHADGNEISWQASNPIVHNDYDVDTTLGLSAVDGDKMLTNRGSTGIVTFELTENIEGLTYTFVLLTNTEVRIKPNSTANIRMASAVTQQPNGYVKATGRGNVITLVCMTDDAGGYVWMTISKSGNSWDVVP